MSAPDRHAWIDASAGVAGDMLLGALADAGAGVAGIQRAVDAVVPGAVRIVSAPVTRAGLRALKVDVVPLLDDQPHRGWRDIRRLLDTSALPDRVRRRALAVFGALADAEAHVHGVPVEDVHFHEVGALDSIADVVGVCAALEELDVATVTAGEVAVGSGRVRTAHGELPVPVPAVTELARGWRVRAGGSGELATPTGMAVVRTLASACRDLPAMVVGAVGVGAGGRDTPGRANVVRVVVGTTAPPGVPAPGGDDEAAVLIEANVDDFDPRLWPGVLTRLLGCGAADAWLVPIVMKKGRPAHTLSVLCQPDRAEALREVIFRNTSTLGVREGTLRKYALPRAFVDVPLGGATVAVKVAHRDGVIVQVMPEFAEVAALAHRQGRPERLVLQEAAGAAADAGLTVGSPLPPHARPG
ncbi:MAG TPA: nickel pincer cofactor biosynthesis protein LarC [Catenuloplanes sp.]